ncbi:Avirulence (Avh) protein [Phytophthora megakarya]|uniref:Avirulence (Avh) protein n=1 Tax=Phytophthora megakarya TaxID=4795 RepID=A0A225VIL8_9STRA|nr:Avirulence (Avh) protein [Phytophthora megakarya]
MEKVWLKSRENPEEVFSILHVRNDLAKSAKFIPWLRYTEINVYKFTRKTPGVFGRLSGSPYSSGLEILRLLKTNARFKILEGYTLQYVADIEGDVMMIAVKHLFDNDKPQAAFVFAMKSENVR